MQSARITATCILAAIVFGIVHDQITAHLSADFLAVAQPRIFPTTDPLWLNVGWGIAAAGWVALLLRLICTLAASDAPAKKVSFGIAFSKVFLVLMLAGLGAVLSGTFDCYIAATKTFLLPDAVVPPALSTQYSSQCGRHT